MRRDEEVLRPDQRERLEGALARLKEIKQILLSIEVPPAVTGKSPEARTHNLQPIWKAVEKADGNLRQLFRGLKTERFRYYDVGNEANTAFKHFEWILSDRSSGECSTFNLLVNLRMLFGYAAKGDVEASSRYLTDVESGIKGIAERIKVMINIIEEILQ